MTEGQHYYSTSPRAEHDPGEVVFRVAGRQIVLETDAGVFSKSRLDRGTRLLIESMEKERLALPESGNFCDLGCGYGPLGSAMAVLRPNSQVYMVDVNERAAGLARKNAARNGLTNVQVTSGSGLEPFAGLSFHMIISNPPLRTGKENVQSLLTQAHSALVPGGRLAIVIRTQQGAKSMEKFLKQLAGTVSEVDKGGGFRVYETVKS